MLKEKVKVAKVSELEPLIGKKVIVGDLEIGLFLTEAGEIKAIHNVCPHKQGPLSEGTVSGDYVFCPLHDQKIDLNTGEVQAPDEGCVATYPVEIVDGDIYVCLP
ncbi:nitrite reductase [Staphylococcus schleiferi]|uniref:Nitrite reductase (NAD(P)H) small subunit n=2 Tax=Staphylococcus TaxID=1279 RepID=A0A0K0ZSM2_STASC|nr:MULTISPECIES: nitrite reductase small subunit NirD [Staphylococcus]QGS46181.1 nitrite reductase small subunit NirD [Mammaliicoccus fleurettii]AKS66352.1 nitrite reductase [Staphylococcus schleiferi]AKS68470.1 nitrite reductase [Staphylococcus schleiferi]AKS70699.1 nitrite reductase [Staphylococcus schleiferi]AKS72867.1 nitrite reductase [Staphylococcus schleiferi]